MADDQAWQHDALEVPEADENGGIDWDLLWLYRDQAGVRQPRPIFTGDVFANIRVVGQDDPATVVILQHPCALFDSKNNLREVLLAAHLVDHDQVVPKGWVGNYHIMPLVVHDTNPLVHQAVAFNELVLVRSADLELPKRVACMEIEGISRLLQRWVNVNTRVVVPCWRYEQVVVAQFAEAEGIESWCLQRQQAGVKQPEAAKEAMRWLDAKVPETGKPRRVILQDASARKNLVRLMLTTAKKLTADGVAENTRAKAERKAAAAVVDAKPDAASGVGVEQHLAPSEAEGEQVGDSSTQLPARAD